MVLKSTGIVALVWLLASCALSPQEVMLRPFIDAPAEPVGAGRTVQLTVVDARSEPGFGVRGGIYDTALITARGDVIKPIYAAVAERLTASQFVVVDGSEVAPGQAYQGGLKMTVEVNKISYSVRDDALVGGPLFNEIHLAAGVRANVIANDGARRSGQFQANSVLRRLGHPSAAENEELINEIIAQALKQLMLDADLRAMLAR